MQTRALRTLCKIAQLGSFAVTADQLNMTLSAVSMQMKTLERELGVDLFDRSFRPPKLTPLGRQVANKALHLLEVEEEIVRLCGPDDQLVGRFRIGFIATASVRLLPGFLLRAAALAPQADFDVQTGLSEALEEKVINGQLDAAVVTASESPDARIDYKELRREPLAFAVPIGLKGRPLDRIVAETAFLHFASGTGVGKLIAAYMERPGSVRPSRTIVLDGVEAILECVKAGIGVTLLPVPDIERYADGQVAVVPTDRPEPVRRVVLATLKGGAIHLHGDLLEVLFLGE